MILIDAFSFFFCSLFCSTLKLKNKIHTLPDRREANEGSLKKEQKRYDHILQLAPAKEMVSLYGRRVFCSRKLIQVLIFPCVSNEKQGGLLKDEAKDKGNAKIQGYYWCKKHKYSFSTCGKQFSSFFWRILQNNNAERKKKAILTTTLTCNSKFFISNFYFNMCGGFS